MCDNELTIRQDRLEEQLLGEIETRIPTPEMIQYTLHRFEQELRERLVEVQKQAAQSTQLEVLHKKRGDLPTMGIRRRCCPA